MKPLVQPQKMGLIQIHRFHKRRTLVSCTSGGDKEPAQKNRLNVILRRKQVELDAKFRELGGSVVDERLINATEVPAPIPNRLSELVVAKAMQQDGHQPGPVLLVQLKRSEVTNEAPDLADRARAFEEAGADALCIPMDSDDTPSGLKDLYTVSRAVKIPLVAQDWFIHPLQFVEAREAGACATLGVVASVSGKGTPILSSFATALGIDCPVEVINKQEADMARDMGVPCIAVNVSVGLSLAIPGLSSDIARGIIKDLPFGTYSVAGIQSAEEARSSREAGADVILIKDKMVRDWDGSPDRLIETIRNATSGDD